MQKIELGKIRLDLINLNKGKHLVLNEFQDWQKKKVQPFSDPDINPTPANLPLYWFFCPLPSPPSLEDYGKGTAGTNRDQP